MRLSRSPATLSIDCGFYAASAAYAFAFGMKVSVCTQPQLVVRCRYTLRFHETRMAANGRVDRRCAHEPDSIRVESI